MLVYENRMPDATLAKLNDHKHQMYQTCEHNGSQKLRNLRYFIINRVWRKVHLTHHFPYVRQRPAYTTGFMASVTDKKITEFTETNLAA